MYLCRMFIRLYSMCPMFLCGKPILAIKIFMIALLAILISVPAPAQDTLKILTWNIQMLPNVTKGNSRATRAKAIVNQLNARDYDVVVFQELFHKRARRIVINGLKQKYPYRTPVLN